MVERVAVIGAGIGGLCTALALAPTGREITLFERDPPPPEGGPEEAFDHWGRRGVGHLRHGHGFLARLRGIFAREHPKLLAELADAGVREISFADSLPAPLRSTYSPRPGDDDLAAFVARRRVDRSCALQVPGRSHRRLLPSRRAGDRQRRGALRSDG